MEKYSELENLISMLFSAGEKGSGDTVFSSDGKEMLKREIRQEALHRLERTAKTEADFRQIIKLWDKLDSNEERRVRDHEVLREIVDYDSCSSVHPAYKYGLTPVSLPSEDPPAGSYDIVLKKQRRRGDFIDSIFDTPNDIGELVTEEELSDILKELPFQKKELLYYLVIRALPAGWLAEMKEQTDRNIRKIRSTLLKRIAKEYLKLKGTVPK